MKSDLKLDVTPKEVAEKSAPLTKLQADYITSILSAKSQIEANLQTAIGMALAGASVDMVQGMGYEMKQDPPRIVYALPDAAKE